MRRVAVMAQLAAVMAGACACLAEPAEKVFASGEFGDVFDVAVDRSGTLFAAAGSAAGVHLVEAGTWRTVRTLDGLSGNAACIAFDDGGKRLAAGLAREVAVFDLVRGEMQTRISLPHQQVLDVAFEPGGRRVIAALSDATVRIFDVAYGREKGRLPTRGMVVNALAPMPDGKLAAAWSSWLLLWDCRDLARSKALAGHEGKVACVAAAADGGLVATGGADRRVLIWDAATREQAAVCTEHGGRVVCLAFSPEGGLLATAGLDRRIMLRRASNGEVLHTIDKLKADPRGLAFDARGEHLVCGTRRAESALQVWKLDHEALFGGEPPTQPAGSEPVFAGAEMLEGAAKPEDGPVSEKELAVIEAVNRARTNPEIYLDRLERLRKSFRGGTVRGPGGVRLKLTEGTKAIDDAIAFLEVLKPLRPLAPSDGMTRAARDHLRDSAPAGRVGHEGSDGSSPADRLNRHGRWRGASAESIAYGVDDPEWIVLQLIIDDGVRDRAHRKHLYLQEFTRVGAALGTHKTRGHMCVITYATSFRDP
jgi:uncharacterized protein YkwD